MSIARKGAVRGSAKGYGAVDGDSTRSDDGYPDGSTGTGYQGGGQGRQIRTDKVDTLRDKVNEVKDVMRDNIEKVIDRGDKVDNLEDRTDRLVTESYVFNDNATKVRKEMQHRNWKLICCIVCVIVVVLGVAAIVVLVALKVI